jgi:hypothetical protein
MEKDIDRIPKNNDTDIVIRIDDFGGKRGVTIREFVKGERYTGFTKAGTRIPADKFKIFKAAINMIDEKDLEGIPDAPTEESKQYMANKQNKQYGARQDYSEKKFYNNYEDKFEKKSSKAEKSEKSEKKKVKVEVDDIDYDDAAM